MLATIDTNAQIEYDITTNKYPNLVKYYNVITAIYDGYDYDEVSCFEHPIIVAMDYIGEGCGKYYAMLSKLNSIYNCKKK